MTQSTGSSSGTFETNVVDRIRKVAAIGFEASKITNIMSSFAVANKIPPALTNYEPIIERYNVQYPFLQTYSRSDDLLQATIVVDLVLSLASNYDICANIFNMITKTWPFYRIPIESKTKNDTTTTTTTTMGYYRFYRNLLSCLHQYKLSAHENLSVKRLLCDECYPLNVEQLEQTLEKEKFFKNLLKINSTKDLQTIDELHGYGKQFEIITCDNNVNYFKRILSFVVNMQLLLQFKETRIRMSVTEILSQNICQIIDEIIFEQSVSPMEIETIACNINTNLVHILAIIISPKIIHSIADDYVKSEQKQLHEIANKISATSSNNGSNRIEISLKNHSAIECKSNSKVINYIKKHCHLLAYLLNEINQLSDETISYKSMCLENLKNLTEISAMVILYNGNKVTTALNYDRLDVNKLMEYLTNSEDFM